MLKTESEQFRQDSGVDKVIEEHIIPSGAKTVVFHCMFSQQV